MTRFEEIYDLAFTIMDSEEIKKAPLYKKYQYAYKFLSLSIAEFNTRCYRDLTTNVPFSYEEFSFKGNGLDKVVGLSSPLSTSSNIYIEKETEKGSAIYVSVPETQYSVDMVSNSITFVNPPEDGLRINIYVYVIGYFYDDLDYEEKSILANGMVIPFIQNQLNRVTLMNQQMYGIGAKMYSQAEHIKRLTDTLQSTRYEWTSAINAYTYSKDADLVLDKSRRQIEIKNDY